MRKLIIASKAVAGALLLTVAASVSAQDCQSDYCIDWYSIAAGGEILSESGDGQWQLSGTIGQPEATGAHELFGGSWHVTGGFWAQTLEQLPDRLFQDGFEND